jgi:hypothetical protein
MVPGLWMPEFPAQPLGYATHARVARAQPAHGRQPPFDSFQLMDKHNDMRSMPPT